MSARKAAVICIVAFMAAAMLVAGVPPAFADPLDLNSEFLLIDQDTLNNIRTIYSSGETDSHQIQICGDSISESGYFIKEYFFPDPPGGPPSGESDIDLEVRGQPPIQDGESQTAASGETASFCIDGWGDPGYRSGLIDVILDANWHPALATIKFGTNDLMVLFRDEITWTDDPVACELAARTRYIDQMRNNAQWCIDRGIVPVFLSFIPVTDAATENEYSLTYEAHHNTGIAGEELHTVWRNALYNLADEMNIPVFDAYRLFADNNPDSLTDDGVHPNLDGYALINQEFEKVYLDLDSLVFKDDSGTVIAGASADPNPAGEGRVVSLDGSGSTGDIVSYQWTQISGPSVTIENANQAVASLTTPEVDGDIDLGLRLSVSDAQDNEDIYDVTVTVTDASGDEIIVSNIDELLAAVSGAENGGPKTILLRSGVYQLDDMIGIRAEGITVRGLSGNRDDVILDGGGMYGGSSHIFNVFASGFTIADASLCRVTNHAIQLQVDIDNVVMRNLHIYDAYEQMVKIPYDPGNMSRTCDNGIMEDCRLEYTAGTAPNYYTGGIDCHNAKNWIVRDNTFINIRSPIYEVAEHAVHFWSDSENTVVERNTIINCDRGIGFGLGDRGHRGGIIRNNFIYSDFEPREPTEENGWHGSFPDVGIGLESSPGTRVYNNTIYIFNYPNAIEYRFSATTGADIRNNLTNHAITSRDGGSAVVSNNATDADIQWFVNPPDGDLHLSDAVEQVVDQGAALQGLVDDIDGDSRPYGEGIDIGADEYVGGEPPPRNSPPAAGAGPDQTITLSEGVETTEVVLDGSGSRDTDGSIARYLWSGSPDPADEIRPTLVLEVGEYVFTLRVEDNEGAQSDPDSVSITVDNMNHPPVLTPVGDRKVNAGRALRFIISASDPDGDAIEIIARGLPRGASFGDGIFTWTPGDNQTGNHSVYFEVTDGELSDGETITVTVEEESQEYKPRHAWYLAEGCTAWGYDCYISIANPNDSAVTASVTYMTDDGPLPGGDIDLPPMSQTTVNPEHILGERDFSTRVECESGKTIALDRTMTWTGDGASSPEGHCSAGVTSPAKTWYLPEGSSKWGFECWLCIQNPNEREATCQVTYMLEDGKPQVFEKKVPAKTRKTYNMADDMGEVDASIKVESDLSIIPERAMYRNHRRQGHCSTGETTPALSYYLAEGTTDHGFTTYILIQNPNDATADVDITYMTRDGPVDHPENPVSMPARSRKTVRANEFLGPIDFSTRVTGTLPIIAERAMYWGEACHDSIGLSAPHSTFYLPDGQTSRGRETWTLVQNPNDIEVRVRITYLTSTGEGNVTFTDTVDAKSRATYDLAARIPDGRAAVVIQCLTPGKIMCERAMYWNNRGAGTDTIGGYSD